ncbi:MAG: 3-oxo-tetronate kinase, partial [Ramlibacter sp.]
HLFVGDVLLSDSGMRNHPLTPMTDSNLVRVLQAQCARKVGLVDYRTVAQGAPAIARRMSELRAEGVSIAIVDALGNDDLMRLGPALKDMPLVTAGSGVAIGLPFNFGIAPSGAASELPRASGARAIISGSCSIATNQQVRAFVDAGHAALAIDPLRIAAGDDVAAHALAWAASRMGAGPVLVYSSAQPESVKETQARLGIDAAGALVERTLAAIARGLVDLGVRQLVVAGGETSGACVQALGIAQLQIGPQIDPGVPWCHAHTGAGIGVHLALKSGNFGSGDFFTKAFTMLQ